MKNIVNRLRREAQCARIGIKMTRCRKGVEKDMIVLYKLLHVMLKVWSTQLRSLNRYISKQHSHQWLYILAKVIQARQIFSKTKTRESFYEAAIWIKGESGSSKPDVISIHNFIITLQTANLYNITAGP